MTPMAYETLEPMPMPMRWLVPPVSWHADGSTLSLVTGGRTDWFVDPSGEREPALNGAALVGDAAGDYVFSARVRVGFEATFDAGVLMLHADDRTWAKLCFEFSPASQPMVVSVVTRGASDDANGFVVDGEEVWLRIARLGPAFAFHASTDGREWKLIRHFTLGEDGEPAVGFEAQSPTGDGCEVTFDEICFEAGRLRELRDGS
jgi:regulation of enolase protein 1 (concanavalin A-like superfamily)